MSRDFQAAVRFPLTTKLGPVEVTVCRGNELYVSSHNGDPLTVSRVACHGWLRMRHTNGTWALATTSNGSRHESYSLQRREWTSYNSSFASASAVQKFVAEVKRAVREYQETNATQFAYLLKSGELVHLNNQAFRAEEEMTQLEEKLAEAKASIATLIHGIEAADLQAYPSDTSLVF
jgi:hypothetical protein